MVLPLHIFDAAKSGDRDAVFAWLDNQDDSGRVVVRAGARVLAYDRGNLEENETRCPALATDEHWLACKDIILGVRAAGSWRAYARLPRKRVLRLRSLMLRGRAKPRQTGAPNVVARAFKLPNEMVWKVLAFWRVESEVTGEVI